MNASNSLNEKPEKVHLEVVDSKNQTSKDYTPKAANTLTNTTETQPTTTTINQEVVAQTAQTTINSINELITNQAPNPSLKLEDEQSSQIQADDITPPELIPTPEAETPNEIELLNTHEQLK